MFNRKKVQKPEITEGYIYNSLSNGLPFGVVLPILETVHTGISTSSSYSQDGLRQTVYHHAPTQKAPRHIYTDVKLTPQQIIIIHAMPDGKHVFINRSQIRYLSKYDKAFTIELIDGRVYSFGIDGKNITKFYKKQGVNPQFVLDVFYNSLLGKLPKLLQEKFDKEFAKKQEAARKEDYKQSLIEKHKEMDKKAEENKIKREKEKKEKEKQELLKRQKEKEEQERLKRQKEKEEQERLKRQKQIEREKRLRLKQQEALAREKDKELKKIFDDFKLKIQTLKETYDIEAITDEEYNEIKNNFINEILLSPIPKDINSMTKIKESKELLDEEYITQDEFDKLKSKFISEI